MGKIIFQDPNHPKIKRSFMDNYTIKKYKRLFYSSLFLNILMIGTIVWLIKR